MYTNTLFNLLLFGCRCYRGGKGERGGKEGGKRGERGGKEGGERGKEGKRGKERERRVR